ncbi:hypothetical protein B0H13DRAFT_2359423 [Mycena leptocephala]|nr:hypothetical protein B0H13DRAFT_2359423 [Mycena leptocephala]
MAPAARTRSNSKVTSAPAPSDKAKGIPKALHFKNGVRNMYTGSQTTKTSSVSSSASARSSNSFSPLVPLQEDTASDGEGDGERTLEEELARTLIGADALDAAAELANRLDKGKGKETEVTPGAAPSLASLRFASLCFASPAKPSQAPNVVTIG